MACFYFKSAHLPLICTVNGGNFTPAVMTKTFLHLLEHAKVLEISNDDVYILCHHLDAHHHQTHIIYRLSNGNVKHPLLVGTIVKTWNCK